MTDDKPHPDSNDQFGAEIAATMRAHEQPGPVDDIIESIRAEHGTGSNRNAARDRQKRRSAVLLAAASVVVVAGVTGLLVAGASNRGTATSPTATSVAPTSSGATSPTRSSATSAPTSTAPVTQMPCGTSTTGLRTLEDLGLHSEFGMSGTSSSPTYYVTVSKQKASDATFRIDRMGELVSFDTADPSSTLTGRSGFLGYLPSPESVELSPANPSGTAQVD